MNNLAPNITVYLSSAAVAAGTTTVSGGIIDRAGYDGVVFLAQLGDVADTAVVQLKAQHADTNSAGAMADVTGAATDAFTADPTSADNKNLQVDVRSSKRYVRPQLLRTIANSPVLAIHAILYKGRTMPTNLGDCIARKISAG